MSDTPDRRWMGLASLVALPLVVGCSEPGSHDPATDAGTGDADAATPPDAVPGSLLFESQLETDEELARFEQESTPGAITRSSEQAGSGTWSAKIVLDRSDALVAGSKRQELKINGSLPVFAERWYGLSVFLPTSFIVDPMPESIFQWHQMPNFMQGEDWGFETSDGGVRQTPLHVQTVDGRWVMAHCLSSVPDDFRSPVNCTRYDLGAYETGVWTDWVIHLRLTYAATGVIEVWKDGEKVVTVTGQTYYNDESGPYFKAGIYKWGWTGDYPTTTTRRTLYIDQVRMADGSSSYAAVAPL